jgi:hypothetical protein
MATRNRNLLGNAQSATGPAKLPPLMRPAPGDWTSLLRWIDSATERMQVREGQRKNTLEQAVTHRELQTTYGLRNVITAAGKPGTILVQTADGQTVALSGDHLGEMIRGTRLYHDLMQSVNDPARFDELGRVKEQLLADLGELAARQGAAIGTFEQKVQTATESFASRRTEITAAIDQRVAGIRETLWAEANKMIATAGKALQLTARLDNVSGSGATIEELYSVVADEDIGLVAQYYLKLSAGGAIAGIGLSAEAPLGGTPTSNFIVVADNFAVVDPSEVSGVDFDPLAPPSGRIPFSISGGVVRINGSLEIGSTGQTLEDLAALAGISITYTSQYFKVNAAGTAVNASIVLGIAFSSGLSGTVTWSHGTGYGGSTPSGTNAWTVAAADQTDDAVTYTATITISGTTYTDTVTLVRLRDGTDALTGLLSNETHTLPADASGVISSYTGAGGTFQVYRGSSLLATPDVAFSYVSSTGFSSAPSSSINATTGVYSIAANINAEVATVTYRATVGSTTLDRVFTITKVRQGTTGAAGANAKILQLIATSDIFSVAADGSTASPTSITFSANGQNLSGSAVYTVVSGTGTATLSGGGGNVLQFADLVSESVTIQVAQDGLVDTLAIAKVHAGSHAITVVAPNQAHALPADNAGTVSSYGGSGTTIQVYEGATALTYVTTTPAAGQYNITPSVTTGTVTVGTLTGATTTTATVPVYSAMTTDVATVLFSISGKRVDGTTFTASITQTLTKSKTGAAGANGADSTSYSLLATPNAIALTPAAAYNPTTIAFSATSKTGAGGTAAYAGRFKIYESADGSTWSAATYTSSGNESSKTFTPAAGKKAIKCELYLAGGTTTLLDTTVVPVLAEGTDAVTAVVANPAQTLPASSAGVVSDYTGSGTTIQIYEGGTLLTFTTSTIANSKYTIGTPTVSPSGKITVGAISGNNTTTATVAVHSVMDNATDKVTITYPVLVQKSGGTQVSLTLTQVITKAKIGATGATGNTGATGTRGSLQGDGLYWGIRLDPTTSAWDDQLANRVIKDLVDAVALGAVGSDTALATTTHLVLGDRVTLGNGPPWQAARGSLSFSTTVWSSGTNYAVNAYVTRTGGTYRAILASGPANGGSKDPVSQPTYWTQVYANTTWRPDADYVQNEYVIYATASAVTIKRALKASGPSGVGAKDPGSTTTYWMDIATAGTNRTSWANSTVYSQYDYLTDSGTVYFANFRHTSGTILILGVASLSADQTAQQVSITRSWNGIGWIDVKLYVDGSAIITGTLSASSIYGGTITGVNIDLTGTASFGGAVASGVYGTFAVVANASGAAAGGLIGYTSTGSAVRGIASQAGGSGISGSSTHVSSGNGVSGDAVGAGAGVQGFNTSVSGYGVLAWNSASGGYGLKVIGHAEVTGLLRSGGSTNTDAAIIGRGTGTLHGGRFHHATTGNAGFCASGSPTISYDFYGDGSGTNYGPFTGAHDGLIPKGAPKPEIGDIVVDVKLLRRANVSGTIFEVAPCTQSEQRGVIGVATMAPTKWTLEFVPAALKEWIDVEGGKEQRITPEAKRLVRSHEYLSFNAVGEGQVNVCGRRGDIARGDLIVASDLPGKGMRQHDDVIRSYTVAKAREAVSFASPDEVKLVACIFLCG